MSARVLLITGASSGIGAATAEAAVAAGWRVALAARRTAQVEQLAADLGGPEHALPVTCDVTDYAQQEAAVTATVAHYGQMDAVLANAGRGGVAGGYSAGDPDAWHDMVMTNVLGVMYTIRAAVAELKKTNGHLLLTGSASGRATMPGSVYSATKWAVTAMGHNVREELKADGVRTTLIEPGLVDTPFFDAPKPGVLEARDVADAVVWALTQPARVDVNEILLRPRAGLS